MKILIIEDEETAAKGLAELIRDLEPDVEILAFLESISETVNWLGTHKKPDLIFMDIQLADGISFKIFEEIQVQSPVIFCTAYEQYAIRAFKVQSIDYLLKPISKSDLKQALDKFREMSILSPVDIDILKSLIQTDKEKVKKRFLVKVGKQLNFVSIKDIAYFYIEHKIVNIVNYNDKRFPIEHTMEEVESFIPTNDFFRINRQFIISADAIESIEKDYSKLLLKLKSKRHPTVYISTEKTKLFKEWLDQ